MYGIGEDDETWEEFFITNRPIPAHPSRNVDNNPGSRKYTFCLNLKSIDVIFQSQVLCIFFGLNGTHKFSSQLLTSVIIQKITVFYEFTMENF